MRGVGFYWVKLNSDSDWVVAFFDEYWSYKRRYSLMADWELHEIDERRIVREVE